MRTAAGRRAIAQAREQRREQSRRIGWRFIPGIAVYCFVASLFIVYMAWTMGSGAAWFMCGTAVGASLLFLWIAIDSVEANRLEMGGYAEQFTEDELRKLRRAGWRVESNVPFENCDVDHVAIGPAGVVVLETKWTAGALFTKQGGLSRFGLGALDQVEDSAEKIRWVLKQGGYQDGVDGCMVVVWGKRIQDSPIRPPGRRASVIDGHQLGGYLAAKPRRLAPSDVEAALAALQAWLEPRRERIAAEAKQRPKTSAAAQR
jgi:hypothetical protein